MSRSAAESNTLAVESNATERLAQVYEPPTVVATFSKESLARDFPEDLTPHIHTVQNS